MSILSQKVHFVTGIAPVANAFAGTIHSDVVNLAEWNHVTFVVNKGVGTTGTSTLTVEACDDVVPTTTSAIAFKYRRLPDSTNVPGALTDATSAGFTTTAGSNEKYIIEVDAAQLLASGYGFIRLTGVEVAASAVAGSVDIVLSQPRYPQAILGSAIT